ncbi:sulfatase [Verrucomicrobiota bacterium]
MTEQKQKSVIFIMADQMAACHVNCYGSGVPSTPTLDALAARGTRFDRCYATSPVCTPNRAVMLSGRSPVVSGMISNNFTMVPDTATYAQVLGAQGYRVGGFGKFHVCPMPLPHPESYEFLGFHESVITEDPKWGAYTEWIRREHPEHFDTALAVAWGDARMKRPFPDSRYESENVRAVRNRILQPLRENSPWRCFYTSPLPPELHQTTWITSQALDFMKRQTAGDRERPFFCHVSYVDPHDPYDPPQPYDRLFRPQDMPDPAPAAWRREGNSVLEDGRRGLGFDEIAENVDAIRQLRAHYHGSIRFIDDQIARIVDFVEAGNLWDDVVILFTTDHGEMLGDHELITKGVKPYDAGIRCPLIVAGGGVQAQQNRRLTCTLDFFPSFCDWAGVPVEVRPHLEGRSFAPVCSGEKDPRPWSSVQVAFGPMETVVGDDGWRLTLFRGDDSPNQLVDLNSDPLEQENRYADPACLDKRRHLFEEMVEHSVRIRTTPQHRNLPVVEGQKRTPGGNGNGQLLNPIPRYTDPTGIPEW